MSKFCEKCGAEIAENEKVCLNCKEQKPVTNKKNGAMYFIIGGIVAVIAIIVTIVLVIVNNAWKKPIDKMIKGFEKGDIDLILEAAPDFMIEKGKEDDNYDYYKEQYEKYFIKIADALEDEFGENFKIKYKVVKKEKIKKDDLKQVEKLCNKMVDSDDIKVSAGYKVKIKLTIKGKEKTDNDTLTVYVYKIDGKWSIIDYSPADAKKALK